MHRTLKCIGAILFVVCCIGFSDGFITTPYVFPELAYFPKMPQAAANPVTVEGVNLGRRLFYDPILSVDNKISCSGCHKQSAAFSDSPNALSEGRNGVFSKRNAMPLFNLAWYPAFFWDGRASSIEEQVFHPVRSKDEMNLDWKIAAERLEQNKMYKPLFTDAFGNKKIDSVLISNAIAQFLRTLISYRSKYDLVAARKMNFTADEYEGFVLVNDQTKGDCLHCHMTDGDALATSLVFSNNGLDAITDPVKYNDIGRGAVTGKVTDNGKFIVPSLRNLAFTAPYMHDGRFKTLDEVVEFYSTGVHDCANIDSKMVSAKQGGVRLTEKEKRQIVAFLLTLSDTSFVNDPAFSDPFVK